MNLGSVQNRAVELLKQNFTDCTFGGEDEEKLMYDIGLEYTFAHVDISTKEENKILVKIYDPESDDEPIAEELYNYVEDVIEYLSLSTWRQVWNRRRKITLADSKENIEKWVNKHQKEYDETIFIDQHPKDGWVAYLQPLSLEK
jgi:tRNA(Phe) wybutosine-synthesizing methylase Tyw3